MLVLLLGVMYIYDVLFILCPLKICLCIVVCDCAGMTMLYYHITQHQQSVNSKLTFLIICTYDYITFYATIIDTVILAFAQPRNICIDLFVKHFAFFLIVCVVFKLYDSNLTAVPSIRSLMLFGFAYY